MDDEEAFGKAFDYYAEFYAVINEYDEMVRKAEALKEEQRLRDARLNRYMRPKHEPKDHYDGGTLFAAAAGMVLGGIFGDSNG